MTLALKHVWPIDAGRGDLDQHLALAGPVHVARSQRENVRLTRVRDVDDLHGRHGVPLTTNENNGDALRMPLKDKLRSKLFYRPRRAT